VAGKYTKMAGKYTKWLENIPNGHKIYQHFPLQDTPKYTQIGIFGLKINHLVTLVFVCCSKKKSGNPALEADLNPPALKPSFSGC
jgi:hypothetical protein